MFAIARLLVRVPEAAAREFSAYDVQRLGEDLITHF